MAPSLLAAWAGAAPPQPCPPQCSVPAQGWWPCPEPPQVSPGTCHGQPEGIGEPPVLPVAPGSWAVNLHYIDRGFLGGSRGAGAGMAIPLSIPAAPRPCTSSPRSHISELCHLHIPQRHIRAVPCPEGPAINQGLPLPHPVPRHRRSSRAAGFSLSSLHCR